MSPAGAPFRFPQAAIIAIAVLGLPAAAHLMAGGELPSPAILAALSCVVFLSAVLLAGRKMTVPVLVVYLAAGQTFLHYAFSALSRDGDVSFENGAHHAIVRTAIATVPHEHLTATDSPLMMTLHTAGTIVAALVLAWGEAALWALARWLCPLIVVPEVFSVAPAFRALPEQYGAFARRWRYLGKPSMRGPPRWRARLPA